MVGARGFEPPTSWSRNQCPMPRRKPGPLNQALSILEIILNNLTHESHVRVMAAREMEDLESSRTVVQDFIAHYHSERNHQGFANNLISPELGHLSNTGEVQRRQRLGRVLNYFYRAAA